MTEKIIKKGEYRIQVDMQLVYRMEPSGKV